MTRLLRGSSLVRALGIALAAALPAGLAMRLGLRAASLAATDAVAHRIDPKGITILQVTPEEGETFTPTKQALVDGLGTLGWTGAGLLMVAGAERLPISRRARSIGLGVVIYALDVTSAQLYDRLMGMADAAQRKAAEAAAGESTATTS